MKRHLARSLHSLKRGPQSAFTLLELLVVIAVLALLGMCVLPALARAKPDARAFQCLNNHRQLVRAWRMYSDDNNDRVANNYGVLETQQAIQNGKLDNWANDVMDWGISSFGAYGSLNTNVQLLANSALGKYTSGEVGVYKCPADNFLSPQQRTAGWIQRVRSLSMNCIFGRFSTGNDPTLTGHNWEFSQYRQYLKQSEVPRPAKTWTFIDEQPDSINDGYYINNPTANNWQDIPASYHDGACGFSFADGHSEIKKWQSATSIYRAGNYVYPPPKPFDAPGKIDFNWYLERCGFITYAGGVPQFGY